MSGNVSPSSTADHNHVFRHTGGGCRVGEVENKDLRCDDEYKCECGLGFITKSSAIVHFLLPDGIPQREDPIAWEGAD